jgi:hypothetical protein
MLFGDDDETGQVEPAPAPATAIVSRFRRAPVKADSSPPVFHPLAYRGVVAEWPVEWRERWGRRANAFEETGLSWRDAEAQAFVEVWSQFRAQFTANSATSTLASSDPEQN